MKSSNPKYGRYAVSCQSMKMDFLHMCDMNTTIAMDHKTSIVAMKYSAKFFNFSLIKTEIFVQPFKGIFGKQEVY